MMLKKRFSNVIIYIIVFSPDLTRVKIVSKDVEKEKNIRGFETDEIFK